MKHVDVLNYLYNCIEYEEKISQKLTNDQLKEGKIEDIYQTDEVREKCRHMYNSVNENEELVVGTGIIKNYNKFIPLLISDIPKGVFTDIKSLQFYWHNEVFSRLDDVNDTEEIDKIRENIINDLQNGLWNKELFYKLYNYLEIPNESYNQIHIKHIIFKAKMSAPMYLHIKSEIKDILQDKQKQTDLMEAFFSEIQPRENEEVEEIYHIVPSNSAQNKSMRGQDRVLSLIQGPPGTGKTQTILNLFATNIINAKTVLVASKNRDAVNNIIEKLEDDKNTIDFMGYAKFSNQGDNRTDLNISKRWKYILQEVKNHECIETIEKRIQILKDEGKKLLEKIEKLENGNNQLLSLKQRRNMLVNYQESNYIRIKNEGVLDILQTFKENNVYGEKIEKRLRQLIDTYENDRKGYSKIKQIIHYILGKLLRTKHPFLKRDVKKFHKLIYREVYDTISRNSPLVAISLIEDIVRYINNEIRLKEIDENIRLKEEELSKAEKKSLEDIYIEKNKNDRELLTCTWMLSVKELLESKANIETVESCIKNIKERGKFPQSIDKFHLFTKVFPLILVNNQSVRNIVPKEYLFDFVVVDEASQSSIMDVISLLQSGNKMCVIGDDKQLSHIVNLEEGINDKLRKKYLAVRENQDYCYKFVSTFDRAKLSLWKVQDNIHLLQYHYRCLPSIVEFSNKEFYKNKLVIMKEDEDNQIYSKGVFFENVLGHSNNKVNKEELDKVYKIVQLLEKKGFKEIGIITPFKNQEEQLNKIFSVYSGRAEIEIGTIHKFQGGECKAIIFTSVISPGSTTRQIHFVQQNARLINVALTRSVDLFILVGNESTINSTQGYLKKLYKYIINVEKKLYQNIGKTALVSNEIVNSKKRKELMNEGEKAVYDKLTAYMFDLPIAVYPKIPIKDVLEIDKTIPMNKEISKYYWVSHFDFVLYDEKSLMPVMAIEYDGKYHRENKETQKKDRMKNQLCQLNEFDLIRISSKEDGTHYEDLLKKLKEILIA